MNVEIEHISDKALEKVTIECVEITPEIEDIRSYISAKEQYVSGKLEDKLFRLAIGDILYFEAVDERVFAYTAEAVYEIRGRLYELEENFKKCGFIRCSKSVLLNIYAAESFSPALNGRFYAHIRGGEKIIVSRQYVKDFKAAVLGARSE